MAEGLLAALTSFLEQCGGYKNIIILSHKYRHSRSLTICAHVVILQPLGVLCLNNKLGQEKQSGQTCPGSPFASIHQTMLAARGCGAEMVQFVGVHETVDIKTHQL